jgi:hypothetical protein
MTSIRTPWKKTPSCEIDNGNFKNPQENHKIGTSVGNRVHLSQGPREKSKLGCAAVFLPPTRHFPQPLHCSGVGSLGIV